MPKQPRPKLDADDFQKLQWLVADAYWTWQTWKEMFANLNDDIGNGRSKRDLMNSFGPDFFGRWNQLLFQSTVIRLCRLVDKPMHNHDPSKKNLSIELVVDEPVHQVDEQQQDQVAQHLQAIRARTPPIVRLRDWSIAHNDLSLIKKLRERPQVSVRDIDELLSAVIALLKLLQPADEEFVYEDMIARGNAETLFRALLDAEKYSDLDMRNRFGIDG